MTAIYNYNYDGDGKYQINYNNIYDENYDRDYNANYDYFDGETKEIKETKTWSFDPRKYSDEQKSSWYDTKAPLNELDAGYCRCLLYVNGRNLFKPSKRKREVIGGKIRGGPYNPFAVCNASISRSRAQNPEQKDILGSRLAVTGLSRSCTKYANFENMPTELLYAFAARERRLKSSLPPVEEFLASMSRSGGAEYRQQLLDMLNSYKQKTLRQFPQTIV